MRFIAFPSVEKQQRLILENLPSEKDNWKILAGPTTSGLFLIEATESAINSLIDIYDGLYIFMEDF